MGMGDKNEKPYWWPVLVDAEFFVRLREDCPEQAHLNNDELRDHFDAFGKYADVWDHLGDAREDWEQLADAFLKDEAELTRLRKVEAAANAWMNYDGPGEIELELLADLGTALADSDG